VWWPTAILSGRTWGFALRAAAFQAVALSRLFFPHPGGARIALEVLVARADRVPRPEFGHQHGPGTAGRVVGLADLCVEKILSERRELTQIRR
jgi:hypothetical protein